MLADGFMETYWSDEFSEAQIPDGRGLHLRPDPRPVACRSRRPRRLPRSGQGADGAQIGARQQLPPDLENHFNPCRNYAYEDEAGLLIATYPEGIRQPMVAAPYAEEVWTGIEYMSASHLIMHGLVDEGMDIVRAARNRHDGSRRNPWNDIECGSYYARSMSAWQLVNAFSGLQRRFRRRHAQLRSEGRGRLPSVLVGRKRVRHADRAGAKRQPSTFSAARSTWRR